MLNSSMFWSLNSSGGLSWSEQMLNSYVSRVGAYGYTFTSGQKALILERLQETYVVSTFGPSGQNKTICDFFYFLENSNTSTALVTRTNTKSGATLRWNYGAGNIYTQNNLPAQINNGVITFTSTDGFAGLTRFDINTNTFINNNIPIQLLTNIQIIWLYANSNLVTYINNANELPSTLTDIRSYTSNLTMSINNWIWPANLVYVYLSASAVGNNITGNVGTITFNTAAIQLLEIIASTTIHPITGILPNFGINNTATNTTTLAFNNQSLTASDVTNWRKGLSTLNLSNNLFNIAALDAMLLSMDNYYSVNTMSQNATITLTGVRMGSPTGGNSNTNLIHLVALATAAGKTWLITVN